MPPSRNIPNDGDGNQSQDEQISSNNTSTGANDPSSQESGNIAQRNIRRLHRAIQNWLNAIPDEDINEFDAERPEVEYRRKKSKQKQLAQRNQSLQNNGNGNNPPNNRQSTNSSSLPASNDTTRTAQSNHTAATGHHQGSGRIPIREENIGLDQPAIHVSLSPAVPPAPPSSYYAQPGNDDPDGDDSSPGPNDPDPNNSNNASAGEPRGNQEDLDQSTDDQVRHIFVNLPIDTAYLDSSGNPLEAFPDNKVSTTKYTLLTFLPLNLFEQFHRAANFYFLLMVILQIIPSLNQVNPAVSAIPLIVVVAITAVKDALEDYSRYRSDTALNASNSRLLQTNHPWLQTNSIKVARKRRRWYHSMLEAMEKACCCCVGTMEAEVPMEQTASALHSPDNLTMETTAAHLQSDVGDMQTALPHIDASPSGLASQQESVDSRWIKCLWREIQVGDIVLLHENETIPADIVLLGSSEPENACYVETKNLDGETNLKSKSSPLGPESPVSMDASRLASLGLVVEAEKPNGNLYAFNGNLRLQVQNVDFRCSLNINNLLLRGSIIRNTGYAYGHDNDQRNC